MRCRPIVSAGCLAIVASGVVACGSSSSGTSHTTDSGNAKGTKSASAAVVSFDSAESKLPTAFPTPTIKKGVTFKLGYLQDQAGVRNLDATEAGAAAEVKALGGTISVEVINANPTTQALDFRTLLGQHVTAIVVQPVEPPALAALVKQAVAAKIPVISLQAPAIPGPSLPGYTTDVMAGLDRCAYMNAQAVARAKPGASYALMPSALPVPALQQFMARTRYWADRFGLKYVGSVATGEGTGASDGSTAMSAIIARYPSTNAAFTFYDAVAEGAATTQAIRAHGKIMVLGLAGDPAAATEIRQGKMFATCGADNVDAGKQLAVAAYDAQTDQHLPLVKQIVVPTSEITKTSGQAYPAG